MAEKGAGVESVRYPDVLGCALCFGWIDGRREAPDERYFLQRCTPRRRWEPASDRQAARDVRATAGETRGELEAGEAIHS